VKKLVSYLIIIISIYSISPLSVYAQGDVSISASSDSTIVKDSSENFGSSSSLICSNSEDSSSFFLVQFDVRSIPSNAVIESAQLSLTQTSAEGEDVTLSVSKVNSSWEEVSVNGVTAISIGHGVGGMNLNSSNGVKTFATDFSELVETWISNEDQNYGLYFESTSDSDYSYEFGSKESSNGPSMSISYSTPDEASPEISDVSVSEVTETSAQVTWTTDEESTSYVEYGETDQYGFLEGEDELVKSHTVELTSLKSNTTYHFIVKSDDEAGNESLSDDSTFQTLAIEEEEETEEETEDVQETTTKSKTDTIIEESISPPSDLTIKSEKNDDGDNIVNLSWEASTDEGIDSYRIFRSEENRISYVLIGEVDSTETNYTDESVEEGKTYFYVVRSVVGEKESRDSNEEVVTIYRSEFEEELHTMNFWKGFLIFNVFFLPIFGLWYLWYKKRGKKKKSKSKNTKKSKNKRKLKKEKKT